MPGAIIAIDQDQGSPSLGSAGVARNDLWQNKLVTVRSTASGNVSYAWTLLDKPPGSATTIATPTAQNATFTPDLPGSYRVQLVTNGGGPGNVQILVAAVTKTVSGVVTQRGWRIPALGEVGSENNFGGQLRGWDEALRFIFNDLLNPPSAAGSTGDMQYKGLTGTLAATPKVNANTSTGEVTHSGTPIHTEIEGLFRDAVNGATHGEARSKWNSVQTPNATPAVIQSISVPAGTWGDCFVTVTWEVTVCAATGGGNLALKATYRRDAGTLSLVNSTDNGLAADLMIAASMAAGVTDNNTIKLTGTGIAALVNWIVSAHIQITKEP